MRVQLRGLSGDPALNGQCGKVGGFEGERVFVRLDNSNRVVKVKTINVRKEGGNAAWTRGEAEGGLCWNCGLRVSECPVCRVAIQQKRRVYS